jgi:hypothetical protein
VPQIPFLTSVTDYVASYFTVVLPRVSAAWSVSDWFTNVFMLVLTAVTLGVAFFYATRLRFWETQAGLVLAGFFFVLGALLVLNSLGVWFDRDYWGRAILRPLVYGSAAVCVTAIGITMARGYREAGRLRAEIRSRKQDERTTR